MTLRALAEGLSEEIIAGLSRFCVSSRGCPRLDYQTFE